MQPFILHKKCNLIFISRNFKNILVKSVLFYLKQLHRYGDLNFVQLFCPHQTNYLKIYQTDLCQSFRADWTAAVDLQSEVIFFSPLRVVTMATNFCWFYPQNWFTGCRHIGLSYLLESAISVHPCISCFALGSRNTAMVLACYRPICRKVVCWLGSGCWVPRQLSENDILSLGYRS